MTHEPQAPSPESLLVFGKFVEANKSRLSEDTITTYRFVWNQWAAWLAGQRLAWQSTDEGAVRRFLVSLKPRGHGAGVVSDVTKRRYWRILKDVYEAAAAAGDDQRMRAIFPRPWEVGAAKPETNARSMIFRGRNMATLRAALEADVSALEESASAGRTPAWAELRDAALMAVLMSTGAKVAELRNLYDNNLLDNLPAGEAAEPHEIRYVVLRSGRTLRASATKSVPQRAVELDRCARRALRLWLAYRKDAGLKAQLAPIFVRAEKRLGASIEPLSSVSVFHTVARFVARAFPEDQSKSFQHIGPESLRNSVIREWIDQGMAEEQVLANAGVRDAKLIRRLEGIEG